MTDWQTKKLGDVAASGRSVISGPFGSSIGKRFFVDEGIPVIRGNNLTKGVVKFKDSGFVYLTPEKADELNAYAIEDDIIYTAAGTIGQIGIIPKNSKYKTYTISNKQIRVRLDQSQIVPAYAYMVLSSESMIRKVEYQNTGSTIPLINLSIIKSLRLQLPPINEQERIVEVLEVWDEYIEKLEQKIALKEQLKIALMQQIFLKKRRLRGFGSNWREVSLMDAAEIERGKMLTSKNVIEGQYPVVAGGKTSPYSHAEYTHEDVITVSASGANAGYVAYQARKIWASDCSVVFGRTSDYMTLYIYYWLQHIQDRVYGLQTGGAQPHVQPSDLRKLKIFVPDINEQEEIVSIFATIDLEVSILEKLKKSMSKQKKYLLQNLITGKIRTPEHLKPKGANS